MVTCDLSEMTVRLLASNPELSSGACEPARSDKGGGVPQFVLGQGCFLDDTNIEKDSVLKRLYNFLNNLFRFLCRLFYF